MTLLSGTEQFVQQGSVSPAAQVRLKLLAVIVLLVLTTRLLSLSFSPLPFNNDGITESRISDDIVSAGSLEYPTNASYYETHSTVTPIYNILLAFFASSMGISALSVAQFAATAASLITVLVTYILCIDISKSRLGALGSAVSLSLLGSFVYLTSSTWKASLGISLFVMLVYAYGKRADRRYLLMEILILCILPLVHHLVAVLAYLFLAYLTVWSIVAGLRNRSLRTRHLADLAVVICPAVAAYSYYHIASLDRLDYLANESGYVIFGSIFVVVAIIFSIVLLKKRHIRLTFAWIPSSIVLGVFILDYSDPLFPYNSGMPAYAIILAVISCVILAIGWYGLELSLESNSRYRAIPLGLLLPVITLMFFAVSFGFELKSHQMIYRSYDFAFLSLALGIGMSLAHLAARPNRRFLLAILLVVALTLSFPFGHATNLLTGVRHDTQEYEVDALRWIAESAGFDCVLHSDERLSYIGQALFDITKRNDLPYMLDLSRYLPAGSYGLYEYEWATIGVNDYPRGHPTLDASHVDEVMTRSNVLYRGGPLTNQAVIMGA
jgi:hypothetical protein